MDYHLESELRDCRLLDRCENERDASAFPEVTKEPELYEPIRRALNVIKQAINGDLGQDSPPSLFDDVHSSPIPSHEVGTAMAKPDLVLFGGATRHWETVRMPIEVKTQPTFLKTGMKQLARDAYAVFANQLHRRHLYGMVVCMWEATFVRFDRGGILHSKPMDMSGKEFRKAFAGLMMLDDEAFGYDTAFTTRPGREGRLDYYVDLPAAAFLSMEGSETASDAPITRSESGNRPSMLSNPPTRRLKVTRTLCHRHTIRGRATIALRLREVLRPGASAELEGVGTGSPTEREQRLTEEVEVLGTRDYVLKLMWRRSNEKAEGEVLKRIVGIYGVAQYVWHSDVFKGCSSPNCARSTGYSCGRCLDKTPNRDNLLVVKNLTNLNIEIPEEANDNGETKYTEAKTDEYSEVCSHWTPQIYCRLLTSTVGSPLRRAESSRQLLQAVLDAILGYWHLVSRGLLHRDISDRNVLMLLDGHGYTRREWKDQRTATNTLDPAPAKSKEPLQEFLTKLNRDPSGMLIDFDLFEIQSGMETAFFGDSFPEGEESRVEGTGERDSKRRKPTPPVSQPALPADSFKGKSGETPAPRPNLTKVAEADKHIAFRLGTPVFMSVRILGMDIGRRYQHHFLDDLDQPTQAAQEFLQRWDRLSLSEMHSAKYAWTGYCADEDGYMMENILTSWNNSWAKNPGVVALIIELGTYFSKIKRRKILAYTPPEVFPAVVEMLLRAINYSPPV